MGDRAGTAARRGRPRASGTVAEGDPRLAILAAAAELFSREGYARATTRAIAERVGLRQSSMFHYFKTKEELLAQLLENTVSPTTALLDRLREHPSGPAERLYALAFADVLNMTSSATNMATLQFLSDARSERFDRFWTLRERLFDGYAALISEAMARGDLERRDEHLARTVAFGIADSVALWENPGEYEPEAISREVADAILLYLLADRRSLASVRDRALLLLERLREAS